jgi:catechol 2,3-dioxygenase-like lactoylglutathione lyase family enzyme
MSAPVYATQPLVPWRGVHHLAFVTPDMDATVRFYAGVLGMPLQATLLAGPMRHYFFGIGPDMTVAFFEIPGAPTFKKGAGSPPEMPIQFDHLAIGMASEAELLALRERLLAAGSEVTEVVDHGIMRSIYFHDNNGLALEASWWTVEVAGTAAGDARAYTDPDPVPAVAELAGAGLQRVPRTTLA